MARLLSFYICSISANTFYLFACLILGHQARFVPTLVLERLRVVGEAAAAPKKSMSGSFGAEAAEVVDADEGINSPKVRQTQTTCVRRGAWCVFCLVFLFFVCTMICCDNS